MESQNKQVAADGATQPIDYDELETEQTIRLIRADGLSVDGKINIKLEHFPLHESQCPSFTAISYVWGEKRPHQCKVVINGRTCQVLESIYPILVLISNDQVFKKDMWFWIDYLCINQDNIPERATQVELMGTLFQKASGTLVWLGEDTPDVRGALDWLKSIASDPSNGRDEGSWTDDLEKWPALRRWMGRPWWTRVWTLQEFLLPQCLRFYCGNESVTRNDWNEAIKKIHNYSQEPNSSLGSLVDDEVFDNQWARMRLLAWYNSRSSTMGLMAQMAYTGHHEATDDKDRVYAVLGLCNDTDRTIVGKPDYNLKVEKLYTRLVVDFMEKHRSLNILCHRALFKKPHPRLEETDQLPTWVPDWRCWTHAASRPVPSMVSEPSRSEIGNFHAISDPRHGVADPNLVYAASAGLPAKFSVSADRDSQLLTCKGIVIDTIDGLGPVGRRGLGGRLYEYLSSTIVQSTSDANTRCLGPGSDPGQQPEGSRAASLTILESLVRSLCLDRAGRYLMRPADVEEYVHQLRNALLDPAPPPPQQDVSRFLAANSVLCVLKASVSEHLEMVGPSPRGSDTSGEDTLWQASECTVGERPWDCMLITTDQGHLGMAPRDAMKGDAVAVLIGCSVPVILRRSAGEEEYEVVGEAFMPGFMKGEAIGGSKTPGDITLI